VWNRPAGKIAHRMSREKGRLPDGSFQLMQSVTLDAPKTQTWIMRRVVAHRYTATLTDASAPVEGEAEGDLFHLS
jgi:hypothetical protein